MQPATALIAAGLLVRPSEPSTGEADGPLVDLEPGKGPGIHTAS
jgi:hypothetical protein